MLSWRVLLTRELLSAAQSFLHDCALQMCCCHDNEQKLSLSTIWGAQGLRDQNREEGRTESSFFGEVFVPLEHDSVLPTVHTVAALHGHPDWMWSSTMTRMQPFSILLLFNNSDSQSNTYYSTHRKSGRLRGVLWMMLLLFGIVSGTCNCRCYETKLLLTLFLNY